MKNIILKSRGKLTLASCEISIDFKILLLIYKILNNMAPSYLTELLHL